MKIKDISIPANYWDNGIKDIEMKKMGNIVIIAGRNGAGKTRLLRKIEKHITSHYKSVYQLEQIEEKIGVYQTAIQQRPDDPKHSEHLAAIKSLEDEKLIDSYIQLENRNDMSYVINFVPKNLTLRSHDSVLPKEQNNFHNSMQSTHSLERLNDATLSYIEQESLRNFYATHQEYVNRPESIANRESFNALNDLVFTLLGARLDRNSNSCTIFSLPISEANLSDGQKVLLQLCVALHAKGIGLNNSILLLDEPENHLHPAAQIEFISKVISSVKSGQVWIATHSIHILSILNATDIWYMHDGCIKYSGKDPERVLRGLLGDEEQIERLRDFIDLPAQLAANTFIYECLFSPSASVTGKEDKQTTQMRGVIEDIKSKKGKVRVLDYGSGKGRLISAIYDNEEKNYGITSWLDYIAFDRSDTDKEICCNAISRVYDNNDRRYYNKESDIIGDYDKNTFDLVIMCNVLHEISPKHWTELFAIDSIISKLLSDDGYLLVVEDLHIPRGEKPNEEGFFILGKAEIKTLFCIPETESNFLTSSFDDKDRLFAYLIPKEYISNATTTTRQDSLEQLKSRAEEEITYLRGKEDYSSGMLLGLWTQQLANLVLYLK